MNYEFLKTSVEERVGWLEYRRPPVNAIDWTMLGEIGAALQVHLQDPVVRVVVIASALEKFFSTGADLRVLQAMRPEDMRKWVEICHALVRQIRHAPKPLLGAIHGTAVGGGLEIVLNCDVRFAEEGITLGLDRAYDEALALELEAAVHLSATPDFGEGLRAFLEKRSPNWE